MRPTKLLVAISLIILTAMTGQSIQVFVQSISFVRASDTQLPYSSGSAVAGTASTTAQLVQIQGSNTPLEIPAPQVQASVQAMQKLDQMEQAYLQAHLLQFDSQAGNVASQAPPASGPLASAGAGSATVLANHIPPLGTACCGDSRREPAAAEAGKDVFATGNWWLAYSTNHGGTWTYINPYSGTWPTGDGYCCDDDVVYAPSRDLYVWTRQSNNGIERFDVIKPQSFLNNMYCQFDITRSQLGETSGGFDYPGGLTVSNNDLWFSYNILGSSSGNTGYVFRINLDTLATCPGSIGYNYFGDNSPSQTHTFVQGANRLTRTAYWASLFATNSIRIYHWDESSGSIFWDNVGIPSFVASGSTNCPTPGTDNWCQHVIPPWVKSGWIQQDSLDTTLVSEGLSPGNSGVLGFAWDALPGDGPGRTYTHDYEYIARFKESNRGLLDTPTMWSSVAAFAEGVYFAPNERGDLGFTVTGYGTSTTYVSPLYGIYDDYSCNVFTCGWEVYFFPGAVSNGDPSGGWGDFSKVHPFYPSGLDWVGTGYRVNTAFTDPRRYEPHIIIFGRVRDNGSVQRWWGS